MLDTRQRSAIQRAFASGLVDGVQRVGYNTYRVPSTTREGVAYLVTTNRMGEKWWCNCTAGEMRRPCTHAAAGYVAWVRERTQRTSKQEAA